MAANYVLLEKITVGAAGASSVTFSGIPQTGYTDLVVKATTRGTYAGIRVQFNGDTAANYTWRALKGDGSSAQSESNTTFGSPYNTFVYFRTSDREGTDTANTFGNGEFYIPNYTSSNQKSVSLDGVSENNATANNMSLTAGLWSGTAAITSITLTMDAGGTLNQNSTFYLYGVAKLGTTPAIVPYATGGDTIMTDGTYWYHAFKSSGTFTPAKGLSCDVLVVAGGGGAGLSKASQTAGGGGAGQITYSTTQTLTSKTAYTTTIGAGGVRSVSTSAAGRQGTTSTIAGTGLTTISAIGGGGGGSATASAIQGGSGGGGSSQLTTGASANGTNTNAGSNGFSSTNLSGGSGGGAGGTGTVATNSAASNGGAGLNTWSTWLNTTGTGVSGYIAGGGAGGYYSTNGSYTVPTGGSGGGGNGGYYYAGTIAGAIAGVTNTGSGGGAYGLGVALG